MHPSAHAIVTSQNHEEEGAVNSKLLPHKVNPQLFRPKINTINTVIVTFSLPSRSPHHYRLRLLTARSLGSNLTGSKRSWRIGMHPRMVRLLPARRLRCKRFPRVCSLSTRSSPNLTSLPPNSVPSHGLLSRPSLASAHMTAVWVGAAVSTSIGKLRMRDGFRPVIAGTGNRRSCRILHHFEGRPDAL
jgi:hypothetical protein